MQLVEETLNKFTDDLRLILKENLFEIIIHGSYVLDDFHANYGDLDFLVLTNINWDNEVMLQLIALHEKYRTERHLLLQQLEGTYHPKSFMRNPEKTVLGLYIGTSSIKPITSRKNSYMDLRLINRKGLKLLGSNCKTYDPNEVDLLKEQKTDIQGFRCTIENGGKVDFGFWITLIHWCARTLFFKTNHVIGSKTEACQWCSTQSTLVDYHKLFNMAKGLRYPYQKDRKSKHIKETCANLLDLVDNRGND